MISSIRFGSQLTGPQGGRPASGGLVIAQSMQALAGDPDRPTEVNPTAVWNIMFQNLLTRVKALTERPTEGQTPLESSQTLANLAQTIKDCLAAANAVGLGKDDVVALLDLKK